MTRAIDEGQFGALAARVAAGESIRQVARSSGVSEATLRRRLRGRQAGAAEASYQAAASSAEIRVPPRRLHRHQHRRSRRSHRFRTAKRRSFGRRASTWRNSRPTTTRGSSRAARMTTPASPEAPGGTRRRGRACLVCTHADRDAIERALLAGQSDAAIAAKFRVGSDDAVGRHRRNHLPATLATGATVAEVKRAGSLRERVEELVTQAQAILAAPVDQRTALRAIAELRGVFELLGKLGGELGGRGREEPLGVPPVSTERTRVLVLLPSNGRAPGLREVSLVDVVREHGLYPTYPDDRVSGEVEE